MKNKSLILLLIVTMALIAFTAPITAGNYPERPIRIIIPFGTGGAVDIAVRMLQPFLAEELGVSVVAENLAGAGGRIAANEFMRASDDGYTLMAQPLPTFILGQYLFDMAYSTWDFEPIYSWTSGSRVVAVHPRSDYHSIEDLIAASQRRTITGSGVGFGVTDHMQSILLKEIVGIDHRYIPFDSGAMSIQAVLGRHTDFAMPAAQAALPFLEEGSIRVLAIHAPERVEGYEDVPTFAELGFEGMELSVDIGLFGPGGMDVEKVKIIEAAMAKIVANPEFQRVAANADLDIVPLNTQEWIAHLETVENLVIELLPMMLADMED